MQVLPIVTFVFSALLALIGYVSFYEGAYVVLIFLAVAWGALGLFFSKEEGVEEKLFRSMSHAVGGSSVLALVFLFFGGNVFTQIAVSLFGFVLSCSYVALRIKWRGDIERKVKMEQQAVEDAEKKKSAELLQRSIDGLRALVASHQRALLTRYRQLVTTDPYGNLDLSRWMAEVEYFIDNVVGKQCALAYVYMQREHIARYISEIVKEIADQHLIEYENSDVDAMTGQEFEEFCARILMDNGWQASLTKGSGDQGVDIIAQKNGSTLAIQCKRYSTPVGNAAVQEVIAGKQFLRTDHAVVVSNASYTPAAKSLAVAAGVHLLHFSDLTNLDELTMFHGK